MKKPDPRGKLAVVIALGVIIGLISFTMPKGVSAEAVQFNVNTSMVENLAALKGNSVIVTLAPGQTITGVVADVKGNLLHLAKISQKEFYDALIAIDHISAIEVKAR